MLQSKDVHGTYACRHDEMLVARTKLMHGQAAKASVQSVLTSKLLVGVLSSLVKKKLSL